MNNTKKNTDVPKNSSKKDNFTAYAHPDKSRVQREKLSSQFPLASNHAEDGLERLILARDEIKKIRLNIQKELGLTKQIRAKAERYQQKIEAKARSQAQMLILQARLATQKEIAELKRKTGEEIQKVLVDIRMIRITAQEELETQRNFTSAARIKALSFSFQEADGQRAKREKEAISV